MSRNGLITGCRHCEGETDPWPHSTWQDTTQSQPAVLVVRTVPEHHTLQIQRCVLPTEAWLCHGLSSVSHCGQPLHGGSELGVICTLPYQAETVSTYAEAREALKHCGYSLKHTQNTKRSLENPGKWIVMSEECCHIAGVSEKFRKVFSKHTSLGILNWWTH